ncbi:MAG: hypothetical protein ACRDM1_15885 [Gaiellaceae bacterium]
MGLRETIGEAIALLRGRTQSEDRIAHYVIREHHRGRPLAEIVEDHYVTNRCTPSQVSRLFERPDVVRAIGEDVVSATLRDR